MQNDQATAYRYILENMLPALSDRKIKLIIEWNSNTVKTKEGTECSGFFDDSAKQLAFAVGDLPTHVWLGTALHEFCHFEQWSENSREWRQYTKAFTGGVYYSNWLNGDKVNPKTVLKQLKASAAIELDCEARTLNKIEEKFSSIIDAGEYSQKANAYVAFYKQVYINRKWYGSGVAPYTLKSIYEKMPVTLQPLDSYWDRYTYDNVDWSVCF